MTVDVLLETHVSNTLIFCGFQIERADIWSEKVRCSSKMKPRLRAECTVPSEQELILASCCMNPMRRNSVFEVLICVAFRLVVMGVTVTSDLSASVHIHDTDAKAHQRSNAIHRCFLSRNVSLLIGAFLVCVCPLVEYNSIVWSPHYNRT